MSEIFVENMKLFIPKATDIARILEKVMPANIEIDFSKTGLLTAKYKGRWLNSIYDPTREAAVRIDQTKDIEKSHLVFCVGFGLGYEVKEILNRVSYKSRVAVVLLDLNLFMKVLESVDITDILKDERLFFIDGTREDFKSYFYTLCDKFVFHTVNMNYFMHPVITTSSEEQIKKVEMIHKDIKDTLNYRIYEFGNCPRDSIEGLLRIMHNFEHIVKSPDIKELKGRFKGIPAICVASGPSLDKNFHKLKNAEGKAIIFGVESNLEKLVKGNIDINAAAVHERVPGSYYNWLKNVDLGEDVVFFGESVAYHKLFEKHKGKNVTIFRNSTIAESIFAKSLDDMNCMPTGISVAHMIFSIAHYLGCSPIIMVGQDLAYNDEGYGHTKGTKHEDSQKTVDEIDTSTNDNMQEVYLPGNNGGIVRSRKSWQNVLNWFEIFIEANGIECVNATEGGAYIRGTKVMTLEDAINNYCTKSIDKDFASFFNEPDESEQQWRKDKIKQELIKQKQDFDKFHNIIVEMRRDIKLLKKNIEGKNGGFDMESHIDPFKHKMIKVFSTPLLLFITQAVIINFGRKLIYFEPTEEKDKLMQLYNEESQLAAQLEGILDIMNELFNQGIKFIEEGEPFKDSIVDLLEMK